MPHAASSYPFLGGIQTEGGCGCHSRVSVARFRMLVARASDWGRGNEASSADRFLGGPQTEGGCGCHSRVSVARFRVLVARASDCGRGNEASSADRFLGGPQTAGGSKIPSSCRAASYLLLATNDPSFPCLRIRDCLPLKFSHESSARVRDGRAGC